jgi:glycosyltransferase involved in cell wall biosynthesis
MYRRISPLHDVLSLKDLVSLLRRERFDIVHTHTLKPMLLGALAARFTGVPIVVNTLRPYVQDHDRAAKRSLYVAIDRFMSSLTTHVLAQNPADVERYRRLGVCEADKITALGNGIDLGRYHRDRVAPAEAAALRRQHAIPPDAIVVGTVARYVPEKGYEEFFRVVSRLASRDPREHLEPLYAAMDVLLFPSHRESFPRVPMEAAAMGLPVVITATSGGRACVVDGENGFVVPVGDVPAMVRAVEQIANDASLRRAMGIAARRLAVREFDQRRVFERVAECYGRLLEASGLPIPAGARRSNATPAAVRRGEPLPCMR